MEPVAAVAAVAAGMDLDGMELAASLELAAGLELAAAAARAAAAGGHTSQMTCTEAARGAMRGSRHLCSYSMFQSRTQADWKRRKQEQLASLQVLSIIIMTSIVVIIIITKSSLLVSIT